jgi:hypothetical protein
MTVPYVGPCFVLGYSLKFPLTYPIGSMYGIYANIWGILMVNVTIYSSTMDPSWVCNIKNWLVNKLRTGFPYLIIIPIGSMYAIYGNIYHQYTPNVIIYTIHGSYGI